MDQLLNMALQQSATMSNAKPLIEFKAGKMNRQGKKVVPDTKRGKIVLRMKDDLLHFQWFDRAKPQHPVDDLILFPGSAQFKKVKKASRIYCLEFNNPHKLSFFWMQEPSDEKDDEYARKINEYIENPQDGQSSQDDAQGSASSGTNAASSSNSGSRSNVQVDQLNQILQSMGIPIDQQQQMGQQQQQSSASSSNQQQPSSQQQQSNQQQQQQSNQEQPQQIVTLQDILSSDALVRFFKSQDEWKELVEHLPEGSSADSSTVQEHATSPQFRRMLATFNEALMSGQLQGVMRSLGIEGTHLTPESFLNAINEKYGNKDDEDKMEDE